LGALAILVSYFVWRHQREMHVQAPYIALFSWAHFTEYYHGHLAIRSLPSDKQASERLHLDKRFISVIGEYVHLRSHYSLGAYDAANFDARLGQLYWTTVVHTGLVSDPFGFREHYVDRTLPSDMTAYDMRSSVSIAEFSDESAYDSLVDSITEFLSLHRPDADGSTKPVEPTGDSSLP